MELNFPTPIHQQAADAVMEFARAYPIQAVLVVNSCARGTATPESDLDVALLIDRELPTGERAALEQAWLQRYEKDSTFRSLEKVNPSKHATPDFTSRSASIIYESVGQATDLVDLRGMG